jgi:hypothetical protein
MKKKQGDVLLRIEDEKSHVAMQAAGKAWKAIKISSAKTWTEWTEVIEPGLVKAHEEAKRLATRSVGARYNKKMGELLQAYGFGNAVERYRSKVTRADLLHCMDYLTEIEEWRHRAKASVLEPVESKQKHCYPDHAALNHPTVVWRRFKASEEGKQAFKDGGLELTRIMHDGENVCGDSGGKQPIHVANRCSNELPRVSTLRHSDHDRRYAASVRSAGRPPQETHRRFRRRQSIFQWRCTVAAGGGA